MSAGDFNTLDGATWQKALTAARKRRKGQGKRVAEAIKNFNNQNKNQNNTRKCHG